MEDFLLFNNTLALILGMKTTTGNTAELGRVGRPRRRRPHRMLGTRLDGSHGPSSTTACATLDTSRGRWVRSKRRRLRRPGHSTLRKHRVARSGPHGWSKHRVARRGPHGIQRLRGTTGSHGAVINRERFDGLLLAAVQEKAGRPGHDDDANDGQHNGNQRQAAPVAFRHGRARGGIDGWDRIVREIQQVVTLGKSQVGPEVVRTNGDWGDRSVNGQLAAGKDNVVFPGPQRGAIKLVTLGSAFRIFVGVHVSRNGTKRTENTETGRVADWFLAFNAVLRQDRDGRMWDSNGIEADLSKVL